MIRIGCLSDTHGFVHPKLHHFFSGADEIWHAGDVGGTEVLEVFRQGRTLRAVYGNIDSYEVRNQLPAHQKFRLEGMNVWMTHIGGYPGNYDRLVRDEISRNPPDLFVCGHSHILRVMFDKTNNLLFVNPGAAGKSGFHNMMTAVRFVIDGAVAKDMEVWEMKRP